MSEWPSERTGRQMVVHSLVMAAISLIGSIVAYYQDFIAVVAVFAFNSGLFLGCAMMLHAVTHLRKTFNDHFGRELWKQE